VIVCGVAKVGWSSFYESYKKLLDMFEDFGASLLNSNFFVLHFQINDGDDWANILKLIYLFKTGERKKERKKERKPAKKKGHEKER